MNNYKIKKIIFILYCFTLLPAIITKCSEKRKNQTPTCQLYFLSLNTQAKFEKKASELPSGNETIVTIECDMCDNIKTGKFFSAYAGMIDHRKVIHLVCQCNEEHKTLRKVYDCNKCNLKSQNPKKPQPIFKLNFSVDMQEKYTNIPKNSRVRITCDTCNVQRSGKFSVAYNNIIQHRKVTHEIE